MFGHELSNRPGRDPTQIGRRMSVLKRITDSNSDIATCPKTFPLAEAEQCPGRSSALRRQADIRRHDSDVSSERLRHPHQRSFRQNQTCWRRSDSVAMCSIDATDDIRPRVGSELPRTVGGTTAFREASSSSPYCRSRRARSPSTQGHRPVVQAVGCLPSAGSDVAQAWAVAYNRSAEQRFRLRPGGARALSGSETYPIGGDIDDSTYLLRVALRVTGLIRPVRVGGGPKPKRNSRTHQHRRDDRT